MAHIPGYTDPIDDDAKQRRRQGREQASIERAEAKREDADMFKKYHWDMQPFINGTLGTITSVTFPATGSAASIYDASDLLLLEQAFDALAADVRLPEDPIKAIIEFERIRRSVISYYKILKQQAK